MKKYIKILICLFASACSSDGDNTPPLSSQKLITSFQLSIENELISGNINQSSGIISFDFFDINSLESLTPQIEISPKATIQPAPSVPQNFSNPVLYNITAEDGTQKTYTVIVSNLSTQTKIESFSVTIDNNKINATINQEDGIILLNTPTINIDNLSPDIQISDKASVFPLSGEAQNFNDEIIYTVTSEAGSTKNYIVKTNIPEFKSFSNGLGFLKFYDGADIQVSGFYMDVSSPSSAVYLEKNGQKFPLEVINSTESIYNVSDPVTGAFIEEKVLYSFFSKIPNNLDTAQDYKLVYENSKHMVESESILDIKIEGSPKILSINNNQVQFRSTIILNGENLIGGVVIPSNALIFVCRESFGNCNITLNGEKTELSYGPLNGGSMFPSYVGSSSQQTILYLVDDENRTSMSIPITML